MLYDVIIIGGGPAGMMAAIASSDNNKKTLLIEQNNSLGKKLLITGKGRCNITNSAYIEDFISNTPVNGNFLYSSFYTFTNEDLIHFFEHNGLKLKEERGGRIFPKSNKSSDVLKILLNKLNKNKVDIIHKRVIDLIVKDNEVEGVKTADSVYKCNSVVIATGGKSYSKTGSNGSGYKLAQKYGHSITPLIPSLVPLETKEKWVNDAQGLSLKNVAIKLYKNKKITYNDFGEMIFTHFGISGPIVLSTSSHMERSNLQKYLISIDLKPALSIEQLDNRIQRDLNKYSRKDYINSLNDLVPKKLIPIIVKLSGIDPQKKVNQITKNERLLLVNLLKNIELNIKNFRPLEEAIITSGGIKTDEINPQTMESKIIRNLYFAGEIIDVDAYTGGYNLQIAFSTGYNAGINC